MADTIQTQSIPVRSESIDSNLIDIPADTREHDPQEIDLSARNLNDIGQLQPIAVLAKEGGRFDVIFGKGRVLAARKAGRAQIDARIYQGLTPYQRLEMMYSENKRREKPNPIYEARLLQGILDTKNFKSQVELAKTKGMIESVLSEYLSFLRFPQKALEIFEISKITHGALRAVKNLNNEDQQIQIAQELKSGKLQPEDVIKRCKQLGGAKGKSRKEAMQGPPDPLAEVWATLKTHQMIGSDTLWEVKFGAHPGFQRFPVYGWTFFVGSLESPSKGKPCLITWLEKTVQGLSPAPVPTPESSNPQPIPIVQAPPPPRPEPPAAPAPIAETPQPAPMNPEKEEARREVLAMKAKLVGRPQ